MKCQFLIFLGFFCFPLSAPAHHSVNGIFDAGNVIELEGQVVEVAWQNPHVRFTVTVSQEGGRDELWNVEITSLSTLRRRKLTADFLAPGDRVRVAGNPAKSGSSEIYVRNILLPSGEEVLLDNSGTPRWTNETLGTSQIAREGDPSDPGRGIFRVWSTSIGSGSIWRESYPLTSAARISVAAFDPVTDSPTLNCRPKGMPTIMEQPYPMEFRRQDERIIVHMEEYNTIRTIEMSAETDTEKPPAHRLGHSVGYWEDRTLVVKTTGINWPYFDRDGIPLSKAAEITEHFTVSRDGSRLDYRMTLTDPATFTEPVVLEKYWVWFPEVVVEPYECIADA